MTLAKCPKCTSVDYYGYDLIDETQPDKPSNRHWSCLDCGLGIDRGNDNASYQAQYAYACGYRD